MAEYTLKVNGFGKVRYVMKQAGANVQAEMDEAKALAMLALGKIVESGEIEGFPVTADGVYFFESVEPGTAGDQEIAPTGEPGDAGDWEIAPTGNVDAEIGADGLPMPAGDGKKKRGRRMKDEVCQ